MSKRVVSLVAVVASASMACSDQEGPGVVCGQGTLLDSTGARCVADRTDDVACGVGTHLVDRTCVPDGQVRYELRVLDPMITADGLTRIPVLALGTNEDGTPAVEPVVLGVSRPNAGSFVPASVELGELGTVAYFRPCSSSSPGCTGPVTFTMTGAGAPAAPAATLDAMLIERTGGSSVASCMTGGNVLFVDGQDDVFTGVTGLRDADWGVQGKKKRVRFRIDAGGPQSPKWKVELSTEKRTDELTPGIYELAQKVDQEAEGRPGLDVTVQGMGGMRQCISVDGRFEVHEYVVSSDDVVQRATISFEQRCAGQPRALRGCLRYQR